MYTEIIQKIYTAFKAKDLKTILQFQDEEVEWVVAGPADKIPWAAPRYGHAGVIDFLKELGGILIPEVFEINEYFENRNKVVSLGYQKGYINKTNVPYEFDFVHVWTLKEGKVLKFQVYYDSYYVATVLSKPSVDTVK